MASSQPSVPAHGHSVRRRLLVDQLVLILLLGGTLLGTTFIGARRAVEGLSRSIIQAALDQAEFRLRRFFEPLNATLAVMADWGEAGDLSLDDPQTLRDLIVPITEELPQVSGVILASEDGEEQFLLRSGGAWRARTTRLVGEGPARVPLSEWLDGPAPAEHAPPSEVYDARTRPWFRGALDADSDGSAFWSAPYLFFTDRRPGMTAALAFRPAAARGSAPRRAIAGLDVLVDDLLTYSRAIEVSPRGGLWILTEDRRALTWPDGPELWGGRDPAEALLRQPSELGLPLIDDAVAALGARSEGDVERTDRFTSGGEPWWVSGRRFELGAERALLIVVMVPQADLLGDRRRLRWWILGLTLAALLAAALRAAHLARRFSEPIEALVRESDRMSQGDLERGPAIESSLTEVHRLTTAQERMRRGLKTLLKLEGDLQIARQIQQKTFPREFPDFPGFDLEAWSHPADETGGDSYDVIGIDDDGTLTAGAATRLVLLLADATGHGIGPALSVTQLRAMLRMAVRVGCDLRTLATNMNEQLHADLPSNRFITAWLGVLHRDGTLETFSASQAPLLLYRAANDRVEELSSNSIAFGMLPTMPLVVPPPTKLEPGDVYVVLSDGFFEASDASGEEVGTGLLAASLRAHAGAGAAEILAALRRTVNDFTGDAPLDDDRTAVIVKRLPG